VRGSPKEIGWPHEKDSIAKRGGKAEGRKGGQAEFKNFLQGKKKKSPMTDFKGGGYWTKKRKTRKTLKASQILI